MMLFTVSSVSGPLNGNALQRWQCDGPHGRSASWNRRFVLLTGLLDRSDFAHWLINGGGMVIEVHDRDRTLEDTQAHQALAQDIDFSDYNVVGMLFAHGDHVELGLTSLAGRKLLTVGEEESIWDPHGVATADLSPLVKGVGKLNLTVPILPCQERGERLCLKDTNCRALSHHFAARKSHVFAIRP